MKNQKVYLGLDFGASSGRAILGYLKNNKLTLEEINRFPNGPVELNGTWYWNFLSLWANVIESLRLCADRGITNLAGIGVDTWGVDSGLIGRDGRLLANCLCYRDSITENIEKVITKKIKNKELYNLTGFPVGRVTSLAQMVAWKNNRGFKMFESAEKWLMMSDLFRYFLSGHSACELTHSGTTQLVDLRTRRWSPKLYRLFNLPMRLMPQIVKPGTVAGPLLPRVCEQTGLKSATVIATPGHDTASAAAAIPLVDEDSAFLICGTWSILGIISKKPITTAKSFKYGFVNEFGVESVLVVRNLMGMYLFENARRAWLATGEKLSYAQMVKEAAKAKPFKAILNLDSPLFFASSNAEQSIRTFLRKTGQNPNLSRGEIIRSLFEGLVFSYMENFANLEDVMGRKFKKISMLGGASRNELLCQMVSDATGLEILAGPAEATIAGNLATQAWATGQLKKADDIRSLVRNSFDLKNYKPKKTTVWTEKLNRYKEIVKKSIKF